MTPDDLSQQVVDQMAVSLPAGYNIAELLFVPTEAKVIPEEALTDAERGILAQARLGAPPMINVDGKPTILRIVKWMCHAGYPNENGDMFVSEELRAIAQGLFRAPNFGVMDWNHAAIIPDGESPPLMGVWYKADYAFNPSAAGGVGAWGVLVTGMLFAWLFPDVADALIAEQARNGMIKGSMACIPKSVEYVEAGGRTARVLHNPVFFTHSLLSRRPADPSAQGLAAEDPSVSVEALQDAVQKQYNPRQDEDEEDDDEDEESEGLFGNALQQAQAVLAVSNECGGQTMTEQELEAMRAAHEAALAALQEELGTIKTELESAKLRLSEAETQLAEAGTARNALASTLEAAEAQLATKTVEAEQLAAELATLREAEADRQRKAKLAARIEELHETYRAAHLKREPELRAKIEAHWAVLSDEEWELKKEELLAGLPARVGYVARSQQEGALLIAEPSGGMQARLTSHLKK